MHAIIWKNNLTKKIKSSNRKIQLSLKKIPLSKKQNFMSKKKKRKSKKGMNSLLMLRILFKKGKNSLNKRRKICKSIYKISTVTIVPHQKKPKR